MLLLVLVLRGEMREFSFVLFFGILFPILLTLSLANRENIQKSRSFRTATSTKLIRFLDKKQ
jgi:hypothetical protein